jgi:hypothetical protein
MENDQDVICECIPTLENYKKPTKAKLDIWRDSLIKNFTRACKLLDFSEENDKRKFTQFRDLPKCLVQLSRKSCGCDEDCLANNFNIDSFDHTCKYFDLDNLYVDDAYRDCDFLDYKVMFQEIVSKSSSFTLLDLKKNFYSGINKLCRDDTELKKLQCSAYEIRDECRNSEECMLHLINRKMPSNCKNEKYIDQLNFISQIFNIPLQDIVEPRYRRSLDEFSNKIQVESFSTDFSSRSEFKTIGSFSITIISGITLALSGYLSLKSNNKEKKISICVGILSIIIFIITSFLLIEDSN